MGTHAFFNAYWTKISSEGCLNLTSVFVYLGGQLEKSFVKVRRLSSFIGKYDPKRVPATKVKAIVKGVHPKVFSQRALDHYALMMCLRWADLA